MRAKTTSRFVPILTGLSLWTAAWLLPTVGLTVAGGPDGTEWRVLFLWDLGRALTGGF